MISDLWPLWLALFLTALAAMCAAPFTAHLPFLARLTGAAPLEEDQ